MQQVSTVDFINAVAGGLSRPVLLRNLSSATPVAGAHLIMFEVEICKPSVIYMAQCRPKHLEFLSSNRI